MNNKKTIFITGAGGASVPFLIKRLKSHGFCVISGDMDPYAVGLFCSDKSFVIPGGNSPDFFSFILDICKREKVHAFIPLVDEELLKCITLEEHNISVITPRYDFLKICLDKYSLMKRLEEFDFSIPKTKSGSEGYKGLKFPIVIKPRTGRGSRGVRIAQSEKELKSYFETSEYSPEQIIFQEYIEGVEYTVSVVVWRDGEVQSVVPKEIISKKGITKLAVTRQNKKIDLLCRKIQSSLHADGPFNVQLRVDKNSGEPMVFEINPRFSTTASLTIAAGIDEVTGILLQAINGKKFHQFGAWKEGVVLLRQTFDQFINETEFSDNYTKVFQPDLIKPGNYE